MSQQYTWSNDSVFELIDLVREHPTLWDSSREDYRDRAKKHALWREIGDHFGLEKTVAEKKMRMLVGQYRRELSRIANGETSKWFAFQKLSFLGGIQDPFSCSQIATPVHAVQNNSDAAEDRSNMQMFDEDEHSEDSLFCQKNLTFPTYTEVRRKRPKIDTKKPHEDITSTETVIKMLCEEKNSRDEFVIYGEYIANKLRNIHSSHARNTAQFHINNILYKAETGQYDTYKASTSKNPTKITDNQSSAKDSESEVTIMEENGRFEYVKIKVED